MNKKFLICILSSLAFCIMCLGAYYYVSKNNDQKSNPSVKKQSDEILIDKTDALKGKILDYEYEISYSCKKEASSFDLSLKGYYWNAYKMPDSPMFYYIAPGNSTKALVKKISVNQNDISIEIEEKKITGQERAGMSNPEEKYPYVNPTCIKITQKGGYPNIKTITIKNQFGDEYQELNNAKKWDTSTVEESGTIKGTDIKYEISKSCTFNSNFINRREFSTKGYLVDTLNEPNAPYYYFIYLGTGPNTSYSMSVDDIFVDGSKIRIIVSASGGSAGPSGDALVNLYKCIAIYNQGDKTVQIEERVADDALEILNELK